MNDMYKAMKKLQEIKSINSITLDEFLNTIKVEEINMYEDIVNKYHALNSRRSEYEPKNDSEQEYEKWRNFIKRLNDISEDYDVHNYGYLILNKGEEEYKNRLQKDINDHINKLEKTIKKSVGNVISIDEISENEFEVHGDKANCKITKTPIKVSSSKNIIKTRLKITDVVENPEEPKEVKEDNEYIKAWKAQELEGFLKTNKQFWEEYTEAYNNLSSLKDEYRKAINSGKSKEELQDLKEQVNNANNKVMRIMDKNSFFYNFGHSSDFEDKCKKVIDKHFEDLQAKVESKIGQIEKIQPTGSNGYDYYFEGTLGSCEVEVIFAGGYNIQRLHTRWIVRNVKLKESKNIKLENDSNNEIQKQTKMAKSRFISLCMSTGREHIPQEEPIDKWTLRDFVSEAQYQFEMRNDSWDPELRDEGRKWKRFVQRFSQYLTNDIKCYQKHISDYDL